LILSRALRRFEVALSDATASSILPQPFSARTFHVRPLTPAYNASAALQIHSNTITGNPKFAALVVYCRRPPPPPPAVLAITVHPLGCTTFHPGDTLGFELRVTNPGGPLLVELKTGARLADGSIVSLLGRHE
jgi:hypothetical protein